MTFLNHYDDRPPHAISINVFDGPVIDYTTKADIDDDGAGGNFWNDPDFQGDTAEHVAGQPLNAEFTPYIVVNRQVCNLVAPYVLGSLAVVTNTLNNQQANAVVADIGPSDKLGEISPALARLLGLDPSGIDGGTSEDVVNYRIYAGMPATINGVTYPLTAEG
jgi:hypothetical protein